MRLPLVIGPGHILHRMGDLRPATETAVHQDLRQFSAVGQGRGVGCVFRFQGPAGSQMGIVQVWPRRGIPLFRWDLRQGFDSLPILEGNHGHSDPVGHKG